MDGYFYGTQSVGSGNFLALRTTIPNTNLIYRFEGSSLVAHQTTYQVESYVQGLEAKLVSPIKDGHYFAGWYDNPSFNGESIFIIPAGQTPAAMYYAKWIPESEIE